MNCNKKHSLPRTSIIKKRSEIEKIIKKGKRVYTPVCTVYLSDADREKVAFLISKRIGNAVKRNRMKRLFREAYRLNKDLYRGKETIFYIVKYKNDFKSIFELVKNVK